MRSDDYCCCFLSPFLFLRLFLVFYVFSLVLHVCFFRLYSYEANYGTIHTSHMPQDDDDDDDGGDDDGYIDEDDGIKKKCV